MEFDPKQHPMLVAMKARAYELEKQAKENGTSLKHFAALEIVAREFGFRDWHGASAYAKRRPEPAIDGPAKVTVGFSRTSLSSVGLPFTIDLKDSAQVTSEAVARLLASKDDSEHRQIRVSHDGIAYLSDVVGNNDWDSFFFALETFIAGNDYVGPDAAKDKKLVARVLKDLHDNWPRPKSKLIDY